MFKGSVVSIHITPELNGSMASVRQVRAVPGLGLEGDRYFGEPGAGHKGSGKGRDITLIESEAVEALRGEAGIQMEAGNSRRNIVTRGVPLNHLVGREFRVGEVTLRGVRLCEPCQHLTEMNNEPRLLPGLVHRGGLRAEILNEGVIRPGDPIETLEG